MTEKQKMYMGILYRADDEHLIAERNYAKGITREYNQTHPDREEDRKNLMGRLLGKVGEKAHIETPFYCNYGYRISIGKNFSLILMLRFWMEGRSPSAIMCILRLM